MNEETSHIAQWQELKERAINMGLIVSFDSEGFTLQVQEPSYAQGIKVAQRFWPMKMIGQYATLADLREGMSNYIAQERMAGRMKK